MFVGDGGPVATAVRPNVRLGEVAAGHVLLVVQEVGAHSEVPRDGFVGVDRGAERLVGADRRRDLVEVLIQNRLLRDEVDRAAGRAAAG